MRRLCRLSSLSRAEAGAAAVAGLAPAVVATILYLGSAQTTVQWGRSGFLCVAALDLSVPPPGVSPLWAFVGRGAVALAPRSEPAHVLAILSAILAGLAVGATGLAALEVIRAARGATPEVAHTPGLRDMLLAALTALGMALSVPLWGASSTADARGLSVFLAALFLWLCLRWRREGHLGHGGAFAMGLVAGVGLTQHLLFLFVVLSGLIPLVLANAGGSRGRIAAPRAGAPAFMGLVLGLLPLLLLFLAPASYPEGLWPTARGDGLARYFAAGLLGQAPFDATTALGPLLARVRFVELVRDTGWLPVAGVALGVVAVVRYSIPGTGLYKGKAISAALWFGVLVFLVGWVPGWSQGGEMRPVAMVYCPLGLSLAAAAGWGVTLEWAENRRRFPLGWSTIAGVLALVLLPVQQASARVQGALGQDAWRYVEAVADDVGDGPYVLTLGRNDPQGLLLAHEVDLAGPLWYGRRVGRLPGAFSIRIHDRPSTAMQLWSLPSPRQSDPTTLEVYSAPQRAACIAALLRGDGASALRSLDEALGRGLGVPANRELAAIVLLDLGEAEQALALADAARHAHPERWQGWEVRGWVLHALGRAREGEASLDVARGISRSRVEGNAIAALCAPLVSRRTWEEVPGWPGAYPSTEGGLGASPL